MEKWIPVFAGFNQNSAINWANTNRRHSALNHETVEGFWKLKNNF